MYHHKDWKTIVVRNPVKDIITPHYLVINYFRDKEVCRDIKDENFCEHFGLLDVLQPMYVEKMGRWLQRAYKDRKLRFMNLWCYYFHPDIPVDYVIQSLESEHYIIRYDLDNWYNLLSKKEKEEL